MKLPVLFSFRRCPYAMRARIAIYYSKISYEHREILLKDRPEMLYKLSAKGTVPVLCLPDGKVIDESLDIMKWAISISDPDSWFVNNKDAQLKAIELNDTDFKKEERGCRSIKLYALTHKERKFTNNLVT